MTKHRFLIAATLAAAVSAAAGAASAASNIAGPVGVPVTGHAVTFCTTGSLTNGTTVFDLGVLTDTTTGELKNNIAPVSKTLNGAICNTASTINVAAQPMTAQSFTIAPPSGFSRSVDYTATASGWTTTPAVYETSQTTNGGATQSRNSAFSGPITVTLSGFSTTGGSTLRLVSDPNYLGAIVVTLAAGN
ncbi:MAG TPA: hypothetical protein VG407_18850 [Caulobacteraceae bacterium]|jgi:hypothetical protein|nr:hypothetical protein [Caulobacteraceae bacterium]